MNSGRKGIVPCHENTLLAQVFYYGELLEKWGTGTSRMITLCQDHGIPEPEFSAHPDWFSVTFDKDFSTEERLLALGLSDRQVKAVLYVREHGEITNTQYRKLTGAIDRTALRDLTDLCTKGIFLKRDKKGRSAEYVLVKKNPDNPDMYPFAIPPNTPRTRQPQLTRKCFL